MIPAHAVPCPKRSPSRRRRRPCASPSSSVSKKTALFDAADRRMRAVDAAVDDADAHALARRAAPRPLARVARAGTASAAWRPARPRGPGSRRGASSSDTGGSCHPPRACRPSRRSTRSSCEWRSTTGPACSGASRPRSATPAAASARSTSCAIDGLHTVARHHHRHRRRGARGSGSSTPSRPSTARASIDTTDRTFLMHVGGKIEQRNKHAAAHARRPLDGLHARRRARLHGDRAPTATRRSSTRSSATRSPSSPTAAPCSGSATSGPRRRCR